MPNVRRCLFPDVIRDQARIDNTANKIQELMNADVESKCILYNFDFKNDVPLGGRYKWFKQDDDTWIGRRANDTNDVPNNDLDVTSVDEMTEKNKFIPIQVENENTPVRERDETMPVMRKRRVDLDKRNDNPARRRIDYDGTPLRQTDF